MPNKYFPITERNYDRSQETKNG